MRSSTDQRVVMIEELKNGKLPAGFEQKYVEAANEVLDLLSFSRLIDRALKPPQSGTNTLTAANRQKLYEKNT